MACASCPTGHPNFEFRLPPVVPAQTWVASNHIGLSVAPRCVNRLHTALQASCGGRTPVGTLDSSPRPGPNRLGGRHGRGDWGPHHGCQSCGVGEGKLPASKLLGAHTVPAINSTMQRMDPGIRGSKPRRWTTPDNGEFGVLKPAHASPTAVGGSGPRIGPLVHDLSSQGSAPCRRRCRRKLVAASPIHHGGPKNEFGTTGHPNPAHQHPTGCCTVQGNVHRCLSLDHVTAV